MIFLFVIVDLTVLKCVLKHVVRHATGSHWHVGDYIEGVVVRWLQIINNIASCIVSNDNLIFLIV